MPMTIGKKRPFHQKLSLVASITACGIVLVLQSTAAADTSATWDGTTNSWSSAADWTTSPMYPQNGSPSGALYDVGISSGTLALDVNPSIQTLNWSGGTITGPGSLTVNSSLTFGGNFYLFLFDATLSNMAGQVATIGTDGDVFLEIDGNSIFNNVGMLTATNGGIFSDGSAGATVNNSGSFTVNVPHSIFFVDFVQFNNTGLVTVTAGTLDLAAADNGSTTGSFSVSPGATLQFDGSYTLTTAASGISGAGAVNCDSSTQTINGTYGVTGPTTVGSSAILNLNGQINGGPSFTVTGQLGIGANNGSGILVRSLSALAIGGTGQVAIANSPLHTNRSLLTTGTLTFGGSTGSWQGQLDLSDNDMIVQGAGATGLAQITNQLKQGFNSGGWNGTAGIISTAAATDSTHLTTLGVILNNTGSSPLYGVNGAFGASFDGQTPGINDVLVKYTYYGDANLDGVVNGTDYTLLDNGFNSQATAHPLAGWLNGDFNYDGVINGDDYILIDNSFNNEGAVSLAATSAGLIATSSNEIANQQLTAVPEPATISFVFGLAMLLHRRRIKCN
jgi:hypothetical protein